MNQQIWVVDTETTGLSPKGGRIVEVGMVHISNDAHITGLKYQSYFNPQRESEDGALRIHKLTSDFLADKPINNGHSPQWSSIFQILKKADKLIMHNSQFDLSFLRIEWLRHFSDSGGSMVDSDWEDITKKTMCSSKYANSLVGKKSLNDLLAFFNIGRGGRDDRHGALEDAELTAKAYLRLLEFQRTKEYS